MKIALRQVLEEDIPVFFEQQRDPEAYYRVGFLGRDPEDKSAFLAHWSKIRSDKSVILRTVLSDDAVAGNMLSFILDGKREVGYWLGRNFRGKGVASRALALFVRSISERPLYAHTARDNIASMRVLEKCGFAVTGHGTAFAPARNQQIETAAFILS